MGNEKASNKEQSRQREDESCVSLFTSSAHLNSQLSGSHKISDENQRETPVVSY
jgi:hypothetical protein